MGQYDNLFKLNSSANQNMSLKTEPLTIGPDGKIIVNQTSANDIITTPEVGLAASTENMLNNGTGDYGTYTNAQGQSVGLDKDAYTAINDGGAIDGTLTQNGSGDWGYKEWGTAGNLGLGAGQLGLGIASYFENKKTADAQRKLLGQQYDSNAELIADRKANKAATANLVIK